MFNEAELEADASVLEPIEKDVKGYKRRNVKTKREELKMIYRFVKYHVHSQTMNSFVTSVGHHSKYRERRSFVKNWNISLQNYRLCVIRRLFTKIRSVKHSEHPFIVKAETPTSLMNHSLASPSSVANVMYQKYVNSIPLYRQEKDWEQLGITLSRATMANWIIRWSCSKLPKRLQRICPF